MRITVVSAHYPPNFLSGGTLQPQRLARGLLARGHDVRVFAGYLDSTRAPLEEWDDLDEVGLPVHWVVSTPWMGWADPLNYDNPAVAERFARHLGKHPAEVVHLHALQTLGAGLVGVAKASGAITVVTMHDFWWVCARQFLVDRHQRPCSLVVDAGACSCEAGREHRETRAARLAELLAPADLVLAPSRSAAEVLKANGVAPDRLAVDENGMEVGPVTARGSRRSGQPVVIRYTGGSNPMKGSAVLIDAAHQLGPQPGLRIIAHDLQEAVERDGRPLEATALELAPAYPPDDLNELLSATDVLLLPSVMRESHSLVTREALLRQVPVIATNTLGPEEVVEDGVNGLIVPAGDAEVLRHAIERVLHAPTLTALQTGAERPPVVRTTRDQIEGLEARFEALLASGGVAAAPPPLGRVLFVVGIDGAPLRYRVQLPAEAIARRGVASTIAHYRDPDVAARAAVADVVVVYRVPATPQVLALIEATRAAGTPVLFDVDDLIFDPTIAAEIPALQMLPAAESARWLQGVERYRTTMEACDAYIGSTAELVDHARRVVGIEAYLFENGVGAALGAASEVATARPRRPGPLRVGYFSGTTTHDADWRHIEAAVTSVLMDHPDVELWLGGPLVPTETVLAALGERVHRIPWTAWEALPELLRDVDINLAPLEPGSRFNNAKSAIKWLEAALVATPTIASSTAPFVDAITPGRTGWLADTPEQWALALRHGLADGADRTTVGEHARRAALLRWSPYRQADRYLAILNHARHATGPRRQPNPSWTPVVVDEPWLPQPTALAPYPPHPIPPYDVGSPMAHPSFMLRVRAKVALVATRSRQEGPVGVVRGAARWARRRVSRADRHH
jgi:glycosyltransferase involved in cell wall biosynthesis